MGFFDLCFVKGAATVINDVDIVVFDDPGFHQAIHHRAILVIEIATGCPVVLDLKELDFLEGRTDPPLLHHGDAVLRPELVVATHVGPRLALETPGPLLAHGPQRDMQLTAVHLSFCEIAQ